MNFKKWCMCGALLSSALLSATPREVTAQVPLFKQTPEVKVDGVLSEKIWRQVPKLTGFREFRSNKATPVQTDARLFLDQKNFYLGMICYEPKGVNAKKGRYSLEQNPWSADNVEVFIGSNNVRGKEWFRQIVVSPNGDYYTEFILPEDYQFKLHKDKKFWSFELVIPLEKLEKFNSRDLCFNLLRWSSSFKQEIAWSQMNWGNDMDYYGGLEIYPESSEIIHGPWSYDIDATSAGVNWETAGPGAGVLYFRKKGQKTFKKALANLYGGVQSRNEVMHPVYVRNLKPDTVYEYHVGDEKIRTFRTLKLQSENFYFMATSDIHNRPNSMRDIAQSKFAQRSDLMFILGDIVSGSPGRGINYAGYLDALAKYWPTKPHYCVRGNHEYRSAAQEAFFELFPYRGMKSYFSFTHKGVFFVVLDTDGDVQQTKSYIEAQTKWLNEVVKTPEFKQADYRIVLSHHPLYYYNQGGGKQIVAMFKTLPQQYQDAFDLALFGHIHSYCKLLPGDTKLYSTCTYLNNRAPVLKWAFPVLVNEFDGFLGVEKNEKELIVRVFSERGNKQIDLIRVKKRR